MIRGRFVAGVGHLAPVVRQLSLGLRARLLGPLEVVPDAVLTLLHHVPHRRKRVLPHDEEQHDEREPAPDDLVGRGEDEVRRLLAVVDRLAVLEELDALLL